MFNEVMARYKDKSTRQAFITKGLETYGSLKGELEGTHDGEIVAIEPTSGDHVLGKTLGEANRAMAEKHPDTWVLFVRVGASDAYIPLKTW
jgi:hypothetical protein